MSAAVQAPAQGITVADRQIIGKVAPHIAAHLSQMGVDDIALLAVRGEDMSDLMPTYQDVPGYARNVVKTRLGLAGDAFFSLLLETTRVLLRREYPAHAALLDKPPVRAWYRANMERMRQRILEQLGAST